MVLESGKYYLVDPNKKTSALKEFDLGTKFHTDKIMEAYIFDNSFALRTKYNDF